MRELEKRLDRLEAHFREEGCTCGSGPGLVVLVGSELRPPEARCPVHGKPLARQVVHVPGGEAYGHDRVTPATLAESQFSRRLPDGRVVVNMPRPERT